MNRKKGSNFFVIFSPDSCSSHFFQTSPAAYPTAIFAFNFETNSPYLFPSQFGCRERFLFVLKYQQVLLGLIPVAELQITHFHYFSQPFVETQRPNPITLAIGQFQEPDQLQYNSIYFKIRLSQPQNLL